MEQSLRNVLIDLLTSVRVTSRSLKLFDLSFNELVYNRREVLSVFLFPNNRSAVILKNSLSFSGSTFSVFGLGTSTRCMTFHYFCFLIEALFLQKLVFFSLITFLILFLIALNFFHDWGVCLLWASCLQWSHSFCNLFISKSFIQVAEGLVNLVFINGACSLVAFKVSLWKVPNWSFKSSKEYTKYISNVLRSWTFFSSSKFFKFLMYLYFVSNLLTGMFAMIQGASWSLIVGHGNIWMENFVCWNFGNDMIGFFILFIFFGFWLMQVSRSCCLQLSWMFRSSSILLKYADKTCRIFLSPLNFCP